MGVMYSSWGLAILPLIVLVLLIVLAAVFTRRSLPDGTALLTPRRLVEGYVYTVVLVTMLLVSSGLGDLVKAGIARRYGVESSYRPQPVYDENHKVGETPKYEYDAKGMRRDVFSGSAYLGVGLLIGMLHLLGLRRLARTEAAIASPVYRLFLIFGLVIYTVAVLTYAVGSMRDILLFRYIPSPPPRDWYDRPVPGEQIAGLVAFLPFWGILVGRLFRLARPHAVPS
jgi:hypothetical protein